MQLRKIASPSVAQIINVSFLVATCIDLMKKSAMENNLPAHYPFSLIITAQPPVVIEKLPIIENEKNVIQYTSVDYHGAYIVRVRRRVKMLIFSPPSFSRLASPEKRHANEKPPLKEEKKKEKIELKSITSDGETNTATKVHNDTHISRKTKVAADFNKCVCRQLNE